MKSLTRTNSFAEYIDWYMHACTLPVTQRMQIVFLLDNEIFRPLRFSVHSLQLLYFPASIAELAGESKSKIKPGKVYYYASIHDSQTFLRLLSPKKCWSSWTDLLSYPYAATLTKIVAGRLSHPEIFEFQDMIKIKNKTTISSLFLKFTQHLFSLQRI